jgi:hypothetical protein
MSDLKIKARYSRDECAAEILERRLSSMGMRMRQASLVGARARFSLGEGRMLAMQAEEIDFDWVYSYSRPNERTEDGVEIVHISGPLEHQAGFWFDSYEDILKRIEGAMTGQYQQALAALRQWDFFNDAPREGAEIPDAVPARAIILCFNSPGGEAAGATAAHRRILALKAQHGIPVYGYANELAASAAYELICAADEIWLPQSGVVGSIGVIATAFDRTSQNEKTGLNIELITSGAFKADGHPDRVLDDGIRQRLQERVDELAEIFFNVVADARGTSPGAIAALEAATFLGEAALPVVADGVAEWPDFLARVCKSVEGSALDVDVDASADEMITDPGL